MKSTAEEPKRVTFQCPAETLKRLDRMAKKGDITRSKLIVNMCESTLDTLEACEKVGFLQLSLLIRDLTNSMKEWAKNMKQRKDFRNIAG